MVVVFVSGMRSGLNQEVVVKHKSIVYHLQPPWVGSLLALHLKLECAMHAFVVEAGGAWATMPLG